MSRPLSMTHEELAQLAERLTTQDNRVTAYPLYQVQSRHTVHGIDNECWDDAVERWHHPDGDGLMTESEVVSEIAFSMGWRPDIVDDGAIGRAGYVRVYIAFEWRFVTAHFTEHAANEYIRENAHNLTEPRVYVSSQYLCHEWIAVVAMLSRKPVVAVDAPHLHDYPRIRRFNIGDEKHVRLEMGSFHSRPVTEAEIRRLRDVLNADAADAKCKPTEHMSGRASVIDHVRNAADNLNESYWSDFEHMTDAKQDDVWAEVHGAISTCLIALGQRTVARVTSRDLARLAIDVAIHLRGVPEPQCAALRRVSDELQQMSERTEHDPPQWTAEPPERDCYWRPNRDGRNIPTSLEYRDGRYWTDQSSYSAGQMVYSGENGGRFLPIPGGIPACPEVTL